MSVTNMIRDEVLYDNTSGWNEKELSNDEIIEKLNQEKKKSFLSFRLSGYFVQLMREIIFCVM